MMKSAFPCSAQRQKASSLGSGEMTFGRTWRRFRTSLYSSKMSSVMEPDEIVLLGPPVKHISTWIATMNKGLSEARYTCHKHICINDCPRLTFPSFPRQQRSPERAFLYDKFGLCARCPLQRPRRCLFPLQLAIPEIPSSTPDVFDRAASPCKDQPGSFAPQS